MTGARIDLIHELVSSAAADDPDRRAVVDADGAEITFAQFDRQIGSLATWVAERTERGDRVAVVADNGASYGPLYYGIPRASHIHCERIGMSAAVGGGGSASQVTTDHGKG